MTPRDQLVEEVVAAWVTWSRTPGHEQRARALGRALHAAAGDQAIDLRRHLETDARRLAEASRDERITTVALTRDLRAAVYGWLDRHQDRGAVA